MIGNNGTNGTRKPRSRSGCVRRRMITPMLTSMNANSVPMLTSLTISSSGTNAASDGDQDAEGGGDADRACGVFSLTFAKPRGIRPSRHIANMIRVWP